MKMSSFKGTLGCLWFVIESHSSIKNQMSNFVRNSTTVSQIRDLAIAPEGGALQKTAGNVNYPSLLGEKSCVLPPWDIQTCILPLAIQNLKIAKL